MDKGIKSGADTARVSTPSTLFADARKQSAQQDKGSKKMLPLQQNRLFSYLLKVQTPQSVADMAKALGMGDPRGHIAVLRRKGYPISDIWCKSVHRGRYKRYYIPKEAKQ